MRFSGIFQTISFTVRKRSVNTFLPPPYTVSKPSKNAPKTAKKIRNACGKNPHPLPPSCGSQSPKNRFVRPFFGILQVLAPKIPARWPFSHSSCVFTNTTSFRGSLLQRRNLFRRAGYTSLPCAKSCWQRAEGFRESVPEPPSESPPQRCNPRSDRN